MSVVIELPPHIESHLDQLATSTGRSKASYLTEAIGELIQDLADAVQADRISERIRSGEERVYTDAEARRLLGLDD